MIEIWAIGGPSRSGKSSLAKKLEADFPELVWTIIHADRFFRPDKPTFQLNEYQTTNWEVPEAIDEPLLLKHILEAKKKCEELFSGKKKKVLIVEGFLLFALSSLLPYFDIQIYLTINKLSCFQRRMKTTPVSVRYFRHVIWPSTVKYNSPIIELKNILILNGDEEFPKTFEKVKKYLIEGNKEIKSEIEIHKKNMEQDMNLEVYYEHYNETGKVLSEKDILDIEKKKIQKDELEITILFAVVAVFLFFFCVKNSLEK